MHTCAAVVKVCIEHAFLHRFFCPFLAWLHLRKQGKPARLVAGIRTYDVSTKQCHFWVEMGDGVLCDPVTAIALFSYKPSVQETMKDKFMLCERKWDSENKENISPNERHMRKALASIWMKFKADPKSLFSAIKQNSKKFADCAKALGVMQYSDQKNECKQQP